jgi:polysaccharide deacetylase 2 family uncharacterized protein YibQ
LPLIALLAAVGLTVVTIIGTFLWLELSSDVVTEEMRASRPQVNVRMLASHRGAADAEAHADGQQHGAEAGHDAETPHRQPAGGDRTPKVPKTADASAAAMHPHPDPALIEKTDIGPLPIVAKDGRQAWRVYSRPFNALEKRPRVAVVIVGLGVSFSATESAVGELPGEVTLAFEPFAAKLNEWIDAARGAGHEVLIDIPMEPRGYPRNDPGPYAMMTGLQPDENRRRLDWVLSRMTGYVGVTNFQGDRFVGNKVVLMPVLRDVLRRGLMFVDTVDANLSAVPVTATQLKLPVAVGNRVVDIVENRNDINQQLAVIEKIAKEQGAAVAVARPYPVSIRLIKRWIETLGDKGLVVAPVSAVANRQKL